MGFFEKLKNGLKKTKEVLMKPVNSLFSSYDKVDDEFFEELFDILVMSDVGVATSQEIIDGLKERLKEKKIKETGAAREELISIMTGLVDSENGTIDLEKTPTVILVIGVNGVGKTTSIGKIATLLKSKGKKVVLAAADTFRAAAIEQLGVWADRAGVPMVKQRARILLRSFLTRSRRSASRTPISLSLTLRADCTTRKICLTSWRR